MFAEFFRVGLNVLVTHRVRSALTVLSITIGAFALVVMSAAAESASATLARGVEEMGGGNILAFIGREPRKGSAKRISYFRGLTSADAEALRERVPHLRGVEMHVVLEDQRAEVGPASAHCDLLFGGAGLLDLLAVRLAAGRAIGREDVTAQRRVAVLGARVAGKLFRDAGAAVGQVVRLGADSYRVVGVAAPVTRFGVKLDFDWNDFVQVPFSLAVDRTRTNVVLISQGLQWNEPVKTAATAILTDRHHGIDDFKVTDFSLVLASFHDVFRIMELIVAAIASVVLVTGGIGVMNIMLVSVAERTREIGVRRALGASKETITRQFLFEAALLSCLGGALGVGSALVLAAGAGVVVHMLNQGWVTALGGRGALLGLAASLVTGVIFGVLPARRAGRLTVVECLRSAP